MIVLVGGEKGGTGKTTLTTNLAALRAQAGYDVLLVDTDRQGTAAAWCRVRQDIPHRSRIACVQLFSQGLQAEVRDLATRYDDVVIDAGGRDSVELLSFVRNLFVFDRIHGFMPTFGDMPLWNI